MNVYRKSFFLFFAVLFVSCGDAKQTNSPNTLITKSVYSCNSAADCTFVFYQDTPTSADECECEQMCFQEVVNLEENDKRIDAHNEFCGGINCPNDDCVRSPNIAAVEPDCQNGICVEIVTFAE